MSVHYCRMYGRMATKARHLGNNPDVVPTAKKTIVAYCQRRYYRAFQSALEEGTKGATHSFLTDTPTSGDIEGFDTIVQVDYSTVNYKDALAVKGIKSVMRINPMIPGIDFAGTVVSTKINNSVVKEGDKVILTGWGYGESYNGGYQTEARVKAEHLIPLPSTMKDCTYTAMSVGTAGYTAMLCQMALEKAGLQPGAKVVVTGSCGGVGSMAILLLTRAGYDVCAITGRPETEKYFLQKLGATKILDRSDYSSDPKKPLDKEKWDGAVDATGSKILANVLTEMKYGGIATTCGLAAGMDLNTTVAPFILRGVSLIGIDSVKSSTILRIEAWNRIADLLHGVDMKELGLVNTIGLDDIVSTANTILSGQIRGRTVVDLTS